MVLRAKSPRTCLPFDNLRSDMRKMYYDLQVAGERVWYLAGSLDVVRGYEFQLSDDQPLTTFKGLPVFADPDMPEGQLEFRAGHRVLGVIAGIS